jgi:hypothetical protein
MPLYTFKNPETSETIDLFFGMNDEKRYVDSDGKEWRRVFYAANTSFDTKVDPNSVSDFSKSVTGKKYTLGDVWDKSAELSQRRLDKDGVDRVKEESYKKYSEDRNGKIHPNQQKEKLKESLNKKGIDIEY